jgi:HEAT repeat protein
MNQILTWLSGGDLRSDGLANEVADFVLQNPELFDELYDGLHEPDDVIRGRAADALEKVGRTRPDLFVDRESDLIDVSRQDEVPMVRWHVAMLLGHMACCEEDADEIASALVELLRDESVFVKSWAIVGLCIIARMQPSYEDRIVQEIAALQDDCSTAVRTRARKALTVLTTVGAPFPKGWIKSCNYRDADIS